MLKYFSDVNSKLIKKIGILTHFTIYSFAVLSFIGIFLTITVTNNIRKQTNNNIVKQTQMVVNSVIAPVLEYEDFISGIKESRFKRLDKIIKTHIIDKNTTKIKIINSNGKIIYSNYRNSINKHIEDTEKNEDKGYQGELTSSLKNKTVSNFTQIKNEKNLLEIYVPIQLKKGAKPVGAYEVYLETGQIENQVILSRNNIIINVIIGIIFIYLVLIWSFKEAYLRINSQTLELKKLNLRLQKSLNRMEETYFDTIEVLTLSVDTKDNYTAGHSVRVADMSTTIAKELGLKQHQIDLLERAALFHDIGKVGIPTNILNKPGRLTDEEWSEIKRHPLVGEKILSAVKFLHPTLEIVRHHHERYDGRGYPDGLSKNKISLEARIIAVADTYDAIITTRPHRNAKSSKEALIEIVKNSGTQFDPAIVNVFARVIKKGKIDHVFKEKPEGTGLSIVNSLAKERPIPFPIERVKKKKSSTSGE